MADNKGFAEEHPYEASPVELKSVRHVRLKIGEAGRVVIPAEMRDAMMVKPGDAVTAEVIDGELRMISHEVVLRRIRAQARKFKAEHAGVSMVDELIAERRAEAQREDERDERLQREAAEIRRKQADRR